MSSIGIILKKTKDSVDFDLTKVYRMKTQPQNCVLPGFYFFFLPGIVSVDMLLLYRVKEGTDYVEIPSLITDLPKLEEGNPIFRVSSYYY